MRKIMQQIKKLISILFIASSVSLSSAESPSNPALEKEKDLQTRITLSGVAVENWLKIADGGNYEASWDAASDITHDRINKKDWERILQKTREPLGAVNKRSILDIRAAKDPKGMPAGDYVVYFYNTSFAKKPVGYELVTLYLQNGDWKVVTYQVD